ncbi:Protein tyrosine kinase/Protein kinase domain containing protein, putative [Angomonas deanei]|uniref:Protein tyrosine kinase/Protein kinase domain containing protein, putative n=1 Tax=Angomonas deanei TaxID=59799 RepID=A0A7G2CFF2_9TRYP|nr:Protein tyrosine kinase/Protein kinase domain containing protein, putative [Angomonas deanei]
MELILLTNLSHKRIVSCLGFQLLREKGLCIFLEYIAGGTLRQLIENFRYFDENIIRVYAVQILEGLEYLHSHRVIHGDMKCANVLVSESNSVRITDFGTSRVFFHRPRADRAEEENRKAKNRPLCGTPVYMSPEMVRSGEASFASDIWALGVIVYEMCTGGLLPYESFNGRDPSLLLYHIGCIREEEQRPSLEPVVAARALRDNDGEEGHRSNSSSPRHGGRHHHHPHSKNNNSNTAPEEKSDSSPYTPLSTTEEDPRPAYNTSNGKYTPSIALLDFLGAMFTVKEAQRPTATDLLAHPFIINEDSEDSLQEWRRYMEKHYQRSVPPTPRNIMDTPQLIARLQLQPRGDRTHSPPDASCVFPATPPLRANNNNNLNNNNNNNNSNSALEALTIPPPLLLSPAQLQQPAEPSK